MRTQGQDRFTGQADWKAGRVSSATEEVKAYERKSLGQLAYEQDLAEQPNYCDGSKRKTWEQLDSLRQWRWERRATSLAGECGGAR